MRRRPVQTPACLVCLRVLVVEGLNSGPRYGRRVHSRNHSHSINLIVLNSRAVRARSWTAFFYWPAPDNSRGFLFVILGQQRDGFPGFPGIVDAEDIGSVE